MRILFLCPSLQPGRDGIGDYSRRLAGELVNHGHECALVALNDRHLPLGEQEWAQQAGLQVLRLSMSLDWGRRMKCARQFLQEYRPDWASLQFGPFAYHPKGLSARLERDIRSLANGCHLHVMCHELWIDPAFPLPLRHRFLGWLQQSFVRRLFTGLRPILVHTQLEHYQRMLSHISVSSQLLPLHGNVPVTSSEAQGRQWLAGSIDLKDDDFVAGFFGDILPTLENTLLEQFVIKRNRNGGRTFILSAGGLSEDGKARFHKAKSRIGNNACFVELGRISEIEASKYLASLDAGLTAYPVELAGKSGGVAAMLEHGKAVTALGCLVRRKQQSELERTIMPEQGCSVSETAMRFVEALSRAGGARL